MQIHYSESVWFKHLILHLCLQVAFPFRKQFYDEILPKLMEKMKQVYVLQQLEDCISIKSFDLWMSKGAHDFFTLVMKFLGTYW
jgi:hypothetical protein